MSTTCRCRACRQAIPGVEVGDAHGVVLTLSLNIEGARWLALDVLDSPRHRDDEAAKGIINAVMALEARIADDEDSHA